MKKALLFISILSLPLFYSCKTETQTELSENQFEETIKEKNDLFSFGKIHKGAFAERNKYFNYDISLDVVNISDNIFEKTIVKADLELVLQNGNILTAKDSDHIMNLRSIESIDFWKSNETKVIGKYKKIHTRALPNHFKEYPIKQAILVLELTATDIVNNSEEIITHNIDITEDWKDFLKKKTVKSSVVKKNTNNNTTLRDRQTNTTTENSTNSSTGDLLKTFNNTKGTTKSAGQGNISQQQGNPDDNRYSTSLFRGKGNGSGWGLNGRTLVSHTVHKPDCPNEEGTVVIEVTVNKSGTVTNAKRSLSGTTNTTQCLVDAAIKTANTFKWRADNNAPDRQIGFVVITFKSN